MESQKVMMTGDCMALFIQKGLQTEELAWLMEPRYSIWEVVKLSRDVNGLNFKAKHGRQPKQLADKLHNLRAARGTVVDGIFCYYVVGVHQDPGMAPMGSPPACSKDNSQDFFDVNVARGRSWQVCGPASVTPVVGPDVAGAHTGGVSKHMD